ncbi:coiled-coil domain-containing protein 32 isoform X1 [Mauremys mutica]|uniref:coiled-coil domain-containing protein 32 isoform X1 n=2 Tax=Mauremys mutica TaxID=74926 RepID=UPI001D16E960|nr:coiled-coil domain-containing protein 32 isoform X1 [Mauremys mutica]
MGMCIKWDRELNHTCLLHNLSNKEFCIMKMIENVDSVVTRSSQDLWAEICSCLPDPDQKDDFSDAFTDSFTDSYISGESQDEEPAGSFQANLKPWAPLKDSEIYLASLERRLMRIKGLSQEVTSKDMLHTLAQAKKECWDRFLQEKFESEFYVEGHESEESTLEHLKRWLQPDKVAISTEEVQYLIPPESHIEKQETGEESPAAEQ